MARGTRDLCAFKTSLGRADPRRRLRCRVHAVRSDSQRASSRPAVILRAGTTVRTSSLLRGLQTDHGSTQAEFACKSGYFAAQARPPGRGRSSDSPRVLRRSGELSERKTAHFAGPFVKRLMGFEPTTFCMASRTCVSWSACLFPANAGVLGCENRPAIPRLLPGVHGGLGTQRAPSSATRLVLVGRARGPARSLCVRSRRGLP
jgi:hypothetical protein